MRKTDADIMHEAREYIADHGWTRETMVSDDGKVCGYGAVAMSQGWWMREEEVDRGAPTARRVLAKVLIAIGVKSKSEKPDIELSDFTTWNDDCAEDQQQVEDAFAKAEKIERAGYDPDA